jgi:polyisoprenoid-binding protein YceI
MKRKKILLIIGILAAVGIITGLVLYFMDWGNEESSIQGSDLNTSGKTIKTPQGDEILDMGVIEGAFVSNPDPAKSEILFKVDGPKSAQGKFNKFTATLVGNTDFRKAKLNIEIEVGSLSTANDSRDGHLMKADFFDEKSFPQITFISDSIGFGKQGYIAHGKISFLGQSKNFSFPFEYLGAGKTEKGDPIYGFKGSFTFGHVAMGMPENTGVGDEADVSFYVEMIPAGADVEIDIEESEEEDAPAVYQGDEMDEVFDRIEEEAKALKK